MSSKLSSGNTLKGTSTVRGMAASNTRHTKGITQTKNQKQNLMTQTTDVVKDERIMRGGKNFQPKPLITQDFINNYQQIQEAREKMTQSQKGSQDRFGDSSALKQSSMEESQMDNPQSSMMQSSMIDSKYSEGSEYSEDESSRSHHHKKKKSKDPKGPTPEELEEDVPVLLQETPTQTLLFIPSYTVTPENKDYHEYYAERNKEYENLIKAKAGSDNYAPRSSQTFNYNQKIFETIQTTTVVKSDQSTQAADWDIEETTNKEQPTKSEATSMDMQEQVKKNIDDEINQRLKNESILLSTKLRDIRHWEKYTDQERVNQNRGGKDGESNKDIMSNMNSSSKSNIMKGSQLSSGLTKKSGPLTSGTTKSNAPRKKNIMSESTDQQPSLSYHFSEADENKEEETIPTAYTEEQREIMHSYMLNTNLKFCERIIYQKENHKEILIYRNYPEFQVKDERSVVDGNKKTGPRGKKKANQDQEKEQKEKFSPIHHLFTFQCEITAGHTVTSLDWNSVNQDLLAASYGETALSPDSTGYLMFWTLKNPKFPEKVIKTPSRVMSCKFSKSNPNLIATGWYNGVVAIYDIRLSGNKPIADTTTHEKKHLDIVWEVQWVPRGTSGADKGENLVSISSDGRVVEWQMKKGLDGQDIMTMKRLSTSQRDDNIEGMNFRNSTGFSFDFLKNEGSLYLASSEDGTIHKCSKSYTDGYLESYFGHKGSVYKVRANPFCSDLFLTCSADWNCGLWNWKEDQCKGFYKSLNLFDEVYDIEWNPWRSTMFGSVAKDGRLEIWDLSQEANDPIFTDPDDLRDKELPARKTIKFSSTNPILVTGDIQGDIKVYRLFGFDDSFTLSDKQQEEKLIKTIYPQGYNKGKEDETEEVEEN